MKERQYKEDWIYEIRIDEKGKEKQVPVYRGPVFEYAPGQEKRKMLLLASLPWVLYVVLLILYFRLDFPGCRILYIFLPAALGIFPGLYWVIGIWGFFRAPRKMTRIQKETGTGRVLRSAAACTVCSCAALIGEIVFLLTGGEFSMEGPGTLMLAGCAACAAGTAYVFRNAYNHLSETRRAKP